MELSLSPWSQSKRGQGQGRRAEQRDGDCGCGGGDELMEPSRQLVAGGLPRCRATELTQASVALRQAEGTWVLTDRADWRTIGDRGDGRRLVITIARRTGSTAPALLSQYLACLVLLSLCSLSVTESVVLHGRP